MVCKENVVSWFGNLSSYKRIDVMCTLLNMCLPFEVRYLGTCVEDLGKRDYNVLRDTEHRANNVSDLTDLTNLGMTDKRTRRKLALYMALLHSCNYNCAAVLYKNLSNFDIQEISNLLKGTNVAQDDQPLEELLLLYTMALNHPAFNYEQKSMFGNVFLKLQEEEARVNISRPENFNKSPQNCIPCVNQNDRMDPEMSANCMVAPPPMQTFQGEMHMRANPMIAGIPPGLSIPPPGLCIPSPEQMAAMQGHPQYVHVGFPSVNHIQPWTGQLMMGHNQIIYHPTEALPFPTSPLVSRQSSPSQSQSHSRSNSPVNGPIQRKNNNGNNTSNTNGPQQQQQQQPRTSSQITQSTSNTLTNSTSTSSSQTSSSPSLGTAMSLPPLSSISTNRTHPGQSQQGQPQALPPLMPTRPLAPMSAAPPYPWHNNNIDPTTTTPQLKQQPPPPRLKPSLSGDTLRETGNKEMPNFKGGFQNSSNNEIRRLSDEDISKIDMNTNVLNNMKSQATNGITQTPEKKIDGPNNIHPTNELIDNEIMPMENVPADNTTVKAATIPEQGMMNYHHQNHTAMANMRRYPPQMDPTHIQMFPPPALYPTQNACYGCLTTVPMAAAGMHNRFAGPSKFPHRCNGPPVYCLTQLQALRLEPDTSRHSHSSSSDSSGSRSPPETPPAQPWLGNDIPEQQQQPQQQHPGNPHDRQRARKNQNHLMRQHKNHTPTTMVNGGGPQQAQQQPSLVTFPGPPGHTPMAAYMPHFPALRPTTGIYSTNFAYARPAPAGYPTIAYQPNGEMLYQYPGPPPPGTTGAAATGTPPQPPPAVAAAAAAVAVQSTPPPQPTQQQPPTFVQPAPPTVSSAPAVTFAPVISAPPPSLPPPKISCYNCGSNIHMAADCKEQTMEDITRRASYRLDYATAKSTGVGDQSQSSEK